MAGPLRTFNATTAALLTRIESHLRSATTPGHFARLWAHTALRILDWSIRHHPGDVDHWTAVAERHLCHVTARRRGSRWRIGTIVR